MKLGVFSALTVVLVVVFVFLGLGNVVKAGISSTPNESLYVTNFPAGTNAVKTSVLSADGSTLYIGGDFSYVGPRTGHGAIIDTSTGVVAPNNFLVNDVILTTVTDGSGGWYIGGYFTKVGSYDRNYIAHILADGSVDATWNPNPNLYVQTIVVDGSTIYVGGDFTSIGGQTRNRIAALDSTTGLAADWNPASNSSVSSLAVSGSLIYVGGSFTSIGGQTRNRIAALDSTTGLASTWDPNSDSAIAAIAVSGSNVYVGGYFTSVGGQSRSRIAALDTTSGLATVWNPNANTTVRYLVVSGATIYAGGEFSSIGGQSRGYIAALNNTTGLATTWNPSSNGVIYNILVSGSTIYAAGTFTTIGGQTRSRVAALNNTTGSATSWNPLADASIYSLAIDGSNLFVGGNFNSIGGKNRNYVAAFDTTTGEVKDWNPSANSTVATLIINNDIIYVGGYFTNIGGQSRNRIAALDPVTGLATAWNPDSSSSVNSLAVSDSLIYTGGSFTTIGGQTRNRIAALNISDGLATTWDPNANDLVSSIVVSNSNIYTGGNFHSIGGQTRNHIAALDPVTGLATAWDPNASNSVYVLAANATNIYAGGLFATIGGQTRSRIAALDPVTGLATVWNPSANGSVSAILPSNPVVYISGNFSSVGGQSRGYIAALDITSGLATTWNPNGNTGPLYTLVSSGSNIYVGGSFTSIGGQERRGIAGFSITPPTAPSSTATTTITYNSIDLSWVDNSNDESSFSVDKSTDGITYTNFGTVDANSTSTTVTGLSANIEYWFRVAAVNSAGNSTYSTISTGVYTAAINPTLITATVNSLDKITVTWSGGTASSYYVSHPGSNSGWTTDASYQFTDLTCNTSYTFSVNAKNGNGIQTNPATITALTDVCPSGNVNPSPVGVGGGVIDRAIGMGRTGYLETIDKLGINLLAYITSKGIFKTLVSHNYELEEHSIVIDTLDLSSNKSVSFTIQSNPQVLSLKLGEIVEVDLDDDKINDISIKFANIWINRVELTIKSLLNFTVIFPVVYIPGVDIVGLINQEKDIVLVQVNPEYYFVNTGTPTTLRLGSGERAAAISSFKEAYGHSPKTEADWVDVLNIANGRWPITVAKTVEARVYVNFKFVYGRNADMKNSTDVNALKMMGYGVRSNQARNLTLESISIRTFKKIFGFNPTTARHWNIIRAISYSGVVK